MKSQMGNSFFNLGARRGGWLTPRPGRFTLGKQTRYSLYRKLGGPQGRSGRVRKISSPQGSHPHLIFKFLLFFTHILFHFILQFEISVFFLVGSDRKPPTKPVRFKNVSGFNRTNRKIPAQEVRFRLKRATCTPPARFV